MSANINNSNLINLELLCDKIEIILSGKTEETGVERQRNTSWRGRGVLHEAVPGQVVQVSRGEVDSTGDDDHHQCQHLEFM